jgi:L-fuculose-phosphate aldolase
MIEAETRLKIVSVAMAMSALGLSTGRSGNVSARFEDGILITPSGVAYDALGAEDIVYVRMDGEVAAPRLKPSSETALHLAIYNAHSDAAAIVHCHSPAATALACAREPIPAFHYMVAVAGGKSIPLAEYATFGTDELATSVVAALETARACLMANHGQVALGKNLDQALYLAGEVETLAGEYMDVLKLGRPFVLDDAEMERVLKRFKSYGQQKT